MSVEFRVYDIERYQGKDHYYDYVEFDVINHKRKRVLSFSIFLDELVHISERLCMCVNKCGCQGCGELHDLECAYIDSLGTGYTPWPVVLSNVLSPRLFKFTEKKQVTYDKRPSTYERPSKFISRAELVAIFGALQEALKRHNQRVGTSPYIATPYDERVDSMYQKVLDQKLDVDLQFSVTRSTIDSRTPSNEVIYVLQ
ncbi:hypothetical protein [Vibrio parahaemolyticus]|uniref:hypothetical protein n=1 Tax=Vibrio parahaemolyticus TaxID=670 RepID=UPI003D9CB694